MPPSNLSPAEQFLLDGVRGGDAEAWRQLVERYRGRLLAFARSRLPAPADAEDVLQETFVSLLKGLGRFRGEAGLETYLFALCRRRIADFYRGRQGRPCLLSDALGGSDEEPGPPPEARLPAPEPTASVYARRAELTDRQRAALAGAVAELLGDYRREMNFRDLKLAELLFYAQVPNRIAAGHLNAEGVDENYIAVRKHRTLKQLARAVAGQSAGAVESALGGGLLTEVWESLRLSCPKRTTLGAYLLGTLEADWADYVRFHVQTLGCRFCRANCEDLRQQAEQNADALQRRILQSTVGFLPSGGGR